MTPGPGTYELPTFMDIMDATGPKGGLSHTSTRFNYNKKVRQDISILRFTIDMKEIRSVGPGTYDPTSAIGRNVANDYKFSLLKSSRQAWVL